MGEFIKNNHIFKSYFRVPVSKVLIKAKESTVLVYRGQTYILIGSGKKITALMETSFWQSKTTIAVWQWNPNPMILLLGVESVTPIKYPGVLPSRSSAPVYYGISLHLCVPRNETARLRSQFPHSCVCEQFIYSHDRSTYSDGAKYADGL